ncbi:MAG: prepilin-type N-terminal cleavage/methylation domain-containing protein [Pseudomonadota bacterium]
MRNLGFTLVELIVVLIVLGILAAVFVPRSNSPAIILSTQAEQFAADLRYVQSLAMTQGWSGVAPTARRYRVNFTATSYNFTDVSGAAVPHPGGTTGPISFTGGVSISPYPPPNLSNALVAFDGLGTPYTDAGAGTPLATVATISMVSGGSTRTIQIFPATGMVRLP